MQDILCKKRRTTLFVLGFCMLLYIVLDFVSFHSFTFTRFLYLEGRC